MKTFSEAAMMIGRRINIADEAEVAATIEHLKEVQDRHSDLAHEALQSEEFQTMLTMWLQVAAQPNANSVVSALFSAFMLGLMIGMEMEKSETGGIQG